MCSAEAFADADIVFADGERSVRQGLRQILIDQGYRSLRDYGTLEIVEEEVERTVPDLIVMDALMDGGEATALTHRIRAGELGINPFVGIIITVWQPSEAVIRRVVNCGTDDIIVKPLSPKKLMERINVVAYKRKPFVVTSDYIGPDRCPKSAEERPGQKIPSIEVPNTLGAKARGRPLSMEALREMIGEAMFEINEQRLKRHSFQIAFLVGEILPAFQNNNLDDVAKKSIVRLSEIANEIGFRLQNSNFEHVANLCHNLIKVTASIRKDLRNPNRKDLDLLKPLSDAILISFNPDRNAAAMAGEINVMLDKFGTKR